MNIGKRYWSIAFLAVLLCISVSSCSYAAERYMMCVGVGVRVRANPSTKAEIISELNKEAILVVDEKNTGEKFLWYKVSLEDEYDSYGWVSGQFLRKMKTKQDYNLDSVNGIGWGTPSSQISDFNLIAKSEIEDSDPIHYLFKPDMDWAYVATKTEDYKDGNIIVPTVAVSYVFDSQKRMKGFFFAVRLQYRDTDLLKAYDMILEKLGESENVMKNTIDGGDIMFYDFNEFKAAFGTLYSNDIGDILLIYGVFKKDIATVDKFDFIALCKTGSAQEIEAAIKAGADVNAQNRSGRTALMQAATNNATTETVVALIKAGADVNMKDDEEDTALMCATKREFPNTMDDIVTILVNAGADVNARDKKKMTPFMYAAYFNFNPEVITTLIKAGANVNAKSSNGTTALMLAASGNLNSEKIATIIIKAGAEVDARDDDGITALGLAVFSSFPMAGVINILIKAGANVNARNKNGWTPLMAAAQVSNKPEIITALVNAGADVNAKNGNGATPLVVAAENSWEPKIITTLIEAGSDAHAKDKKGKRAIDYAKDNKNIVNTDAYWKLNDVSY